MAAVIVWGRCYDLVGGEDRLDKSRQESIIRRIVTLGISSKLQSTLAHRAELHPHTHTRPDAEYPIIRIVSFPATPP